MTAMLRGHTCFNRIDLPEYATREELRSVLGQFDFAGAAEMDDFAHVDGDEMRRRNGR